MRHSSPLPSLFGLFAALVLVGAGCLGPQTPETPSVPVTPDTPDTESMQIDDGTPLENPDADMIDSTSTAPAATSTSQTEPKTDEPKPVAKASYVGFTRAGYESALTKKVPVLLFFYANWCPTCKAQEPQNIDVFKTLDLPVQAFRVNFNDSETDDEERKLAKAFGVTYQHTFIFLDANGKEITRKVGPVPPEELRNLLKEVANR